MSAAEEFANDVITRFGMPESGVPGALPFYKAMLEYAFSSGQVHKSAQSQTALDEAFHQMDQARKALS